MTMPNVDTPAVTSESGSSRFRRVCVSIAVVTAVVVFVWIVLWPQLDGHYTSNAGEITVDVAFDSSGTHVTLSGDAGADGAERRMEGTRAFTTVSFGTDILQRKVLVFHPFYSGPGQYKLVSGCRSVILNKSTLGSRFVLAHPYVTILGVTAGLLVFMGYVLNQKAQSEPEAIFPMWLAYFVAFFASAGVLGWAGSSGMFGLDGVPRNLVARAIVRGTDWFLAVNDECTLLLAILAMIVLPQWCAYIAAGFSGAASSAAFHGARAHLQPHRRDPGART
ncbi:hypothetical protein [Paraburkholderia sediminicola]|uniref:hypothetical protein n=1 Tax=Paraburkholderia sediminicola TaxID=458836 RepID=UPI0038B9F098